MINQMTGKCKEGIISEKYVSDGEETGVKEEGHAQNHKEDAKGRQAHADFCAQLALYAERYLGLLWVSVSQVMAPLQVCSQVRNDNWQQRQVRVIVN